MSEQQTPDQRAAPFDSSALYRHLSRKFNDGAEGCPTDRSMGECPCLDQMQPGSNRYEAYLYIWPAGFHLTAAQVAGWFTEMGAEDVFITHVLHDPWNETFEGSCNDGAKNWLVHFVARDPAAIQKATEATPS